MVERVIKLQDVGEGVAEAEIVELPVKVGEAVREGDVLAAVMTDKATVEIPSPADGRVSWIGWEIGQKVAVGSELIRIEVGDVGGVESKRRAGGADLDHGARGTAAVLSRVLEEQRQATSDGKAASSRQARQSAPPSVSGDAFARPGERPMAAPAVRAHARERGVDLRDVPGSGPAGRILREDVDAFVAGGHAQLPVQTLLPNTAVEEIKIVGLRRAIAQRVQESKRRIPHFSYIEEIDVTDLEALRENLNANKERESPRLTVLPFVMRALVMALGDYPQMNALFDDGSETLRRYAGVHLGIAVQTTNGLMVPVVRHAEQRTIRQCAVELRRLTEAARCGGIAREELTGSTITITSLGALGGLATTPVINAPEVAIIGVNKIAVRPVWRDASFQPRKVMNISASFDHRIIDGWDAAAFIQHLRSFLEAPRRIVNAA